MLIRDLLPPSHPERGTTPSTPRPPVTRLRTKMLSLQWAKDTAPTMRAFLTLTAWFSLVAPLWFVTIKTHRAPLDYSALERCDADVGNLLLARVPVALHTTPELVDIVAASQFVADSRLHKLGVHNWTLEFMDAADIPDSSKPLEVALKHESHSGFHLEPTGRLLSLNYDLKLLQSGHVADMIVDILIDQVFKTEIEQWSAGGAAGGSTASLSPQYHIAVSVLSGGGDSVEWAPATFASRFAGLASYLDSNVCNITVDSQVDHYARPGVTPVLEDGVFTLDHSSLATFVNFAEWNFASTVPYPALNFVLYVPDKSQSPLEIKNSTTNSFVVSQWGGVVIQNTADIAAFYSVFQSQLLTLLGAPTEPASLLLRLDSLSRLFAARTIRATAASLGSLARLANQMEQIPIPGSVAENSNTALQYLRGALDACSQGQFALANHRGGIALKHAEAAFFDKHMVSQAFFPDEHKMAVYLPLLAPIALLLFQRWKNISLFRNLEFRKLLEQCDKQARLDKTELQKGKLE